MTQKLLSRLIVPVAGARARMASGESWASLMPTVLHVRCVQRALEGVAAKGVVVRHMLPAAVFALRQLLHVEPYLLGEELRQLLVDPVLPRELLGQDSRAVAVIDVDVFVLSVSDFNCDREHLSAACICPVVVRVGVGRGVVARLLAVGVVPGGRGLGACQALATEMCCLVGLRQCGWATAAGPVRQIRMQGLV